MYRDWTGVFASNGTELAHHGGCSSHVQGELVRVSFGNSHYLTLKIHTEHEGSRVKSEFCVLQEGKGLDSGINKTNLALIIFNFCIL